MKPALQTKDNVQIVLETGVSETATDFLLETGEGEKLPQPISSSATSSGDTITLNSTGIGTLGIAVGSEIWNVTDGSHATVVSVSTNQLISTPLRGGTSDNWVSADVFSVNPFLLTLVRYSTDGTTEVQKEIVRFYKRVGDLITTDSNGRGYADTTALIWNPGDYGEMRTVSVFFQEIHEKINELRQLLEASAIITGDKVFSGDIDFEAFPILPTSNPTTDYQAIHKKYVDDLIAASSAGVIDSDPRTPSNYTEGPVSLIDATAYQADYTGPTSFSFWTKRLTTNDATTIPIITIPLAGYAAGTYQFRIEIRELDPVTNEPSTVVGTYNSGNYVITNSYAQGFLDYDFPVNFTVQPSKAYWIGFKCSNYASMYHKQIMTALQNPHAYIAYVNGVADLRTTPAYSTPTGGVMMYSPYLEDRAWLEPFGAQTNQATLLIQGVMSLKDGSVSINNPVSVASADVGKYYKYAEAGLVLSTDSTAHADSDLFYCVNPNEIFKV